MSSVGDDVEQDVPQEEHPVLNVADGPVSSDFPLPELNCSADTETGDGITEGKTGLRSGSSSSPLKESSAGTLTLTSYTELSNSIDCFPTSASPEGLSDGSGPGGQESAAVDVTVAAASGDGKDTTTGVQFASPGVIEGRDDTVVATGERTSSSAEVLGNVHSSPAADASEVEFGSTALVRDHEVEVIEGRDDTVVATGERTSSSGEILGNVHSSSPADASGVEFGSTALVRDHEVAVDQSSSWEWPPAFAEEHESEVASPPPAFREDEEEEKAVEFPSPEDVPTTEDHTVVKDAMPTELSALAGVSTDDVVVLQNNSAVEPVSPASIGRHDVVVVDDTVATEFSSPADDGDDNAVLVQDTGAVELASPSLVRDDDVAPVDDAMTVGFASLAGLPHYDSVVLRDSTTDEVTSADVAGDKDEVMVGDKDEVMVADKDEVMEEAMAVVVVVQDHDSSQSGGVASPPISSGMGNEVASPPVVLDSIAVNHDQASSSCAQPGDSSSLTHNVIDKEGSLCRATDGPFEDHSASVPFPVVSDVPMAAEQEEQMLDAEEAPEALEVLSPPEDPMSPRSVKLSPVHGSECVSTFDASEKADLVEDCTLEEEQPAKRAKTSGAIYSGADAVAVVLGQTAEIVLVLAGMAQMRAGRMPTSYERELAETAYQNLGILVSKVAPNNLVPKESLERMLQEYNMRKVAQKKREEQAWVAALSEAEALANVRAESLARAEAEAAARAQAEMAARAQAEAEAEARAQAEAAASAQAEAAARAQAESDERRPQPAAMMAAATAANGPSKDDSSPLESSRLTSGQSPCRVPELAQSASLPVPDVHPNTQAEVGSHVLSPVSTAVEVPLLVTQTEKSMSVNGHTPASKPTLRRPPKVRNRVRKEPATVTLFAPEFLTVAPGQAPDPQKAYVTHKQLCLGVQQFIREHVPPVSQDLQALPPTYISTPIPCQVCKLIAKDTGSVLVCDSCDEVSHVKCVQPPSSRGASKGDWNCPKCLTASRGGKCPSKYGPIRHGSPNSVKLWPPHDISPGNPEPLSSISNGEVRGDGKLATAGRQIDSGLLIAQEKAGLEIDTHAHQSTDDRSTGNVGSSPHLIVQLVNEPSPRTSHPIQSSSHSLVQEDNQGLLQSGKSVSSLGHQSSSPLVPLKNVATEDKTQLQGKAGMTLSAENDSLKIAEDEGKSGKGLEKNDSRSAAIGVEGVRLEAKYRRATPTHIKKTETRTQAMHSKKGNVDSGTVSQGKQAEVPLPIVMEWVGESIRKGDGKIYYRACSVGGITFSVSDCALFRPETPDVPPYIARLQVLWEDIATGHKWVRVSWCYYPTDIPLAMGRPGTTAPDEVYESNHCDNNLVGSIQGPCFVLPPLKFIEETERRRTQKQRGDPVEELPPIFLSRWMYDAPKGVFRPLQE